MVFPWISYLEQLGEDEMSSIKVPIGGLVDTEAQSSIDLTLPDNFDVDVDMRVNSSTQIISATILTAHWGDTQGTEEVQAPANKKLICLLRLLPNSPTAFAYTVRASDNIDTADGALLFTSGDVPGTTGRSIPSKLIIIPAGKYLTVIANVSNTMNLGALITIELDA